MYNFTRDTTEPVEQIRERIRKMPDDVLERYGKAAASMAERSDRETWRVQLAEARAEWRRRHAAEAPAESNSLRGQ